MSEFIKNVDNSFKSAAIAATSAFKTNARILGRTANKVDGLDKFFKFIVPVGDLFTYCVGSIKSYSIIKTEMNAFSEFVNALSIISRIKEWSDGSERKKFLKDWKQTVQKVTLTAANLLGAVKFLDTIKLVSLGQICSKTVQLPIFGIVTLSPIGLASNGLMLIFLSVSSIEQLGKLGEADDHSKKAKVDLLKVKKWESKVEALKNDPAAAKAKEADLKKAIRRVKMWKEASDVHSKAKPKIWISVANSISKIGLICFATIGITFIGMTAAPAMLSLLTLGVIGGALGYAKFLYDEQYADQKEHVLKLAAKTGKKTAVI